MVVGRGKIAARQCCINLVVAQRLVVVKACRDGMRAGVRHIGRAVARVLMKIGVREFSAYSARIAHNERHVNTEEVAAFDVPVYHCAIAVLKTIVPDGCYLVVYDVVVAGGGKRVTAFGIFTRESERVRVFCTEVGVAVDVEYAGHIKVHVHLLECGRTKTTRVRTAYVEMSGAVHGSNLRRHFPTRFGKIVGTCSGNDVPVFRQCPISLREGIGSVLLAVAVVGKLISHKIINHRVSTDSQCEVVLQMVRVECAQRILHILVVDDVLLYLLVVVALVVTVERVTYVELVLVRERGQKAQTSAEVACPVVGYCRRVSLVKVVAGTPCERHAIVEPVCQFLFEVPLACAVYGHPVALVLAVERISVGAVSLHVGQRIPFARLYAKRTTVTLPIVFRAEMGVEVERPRVDGFLGDDVYHCANRVGAVQGRCRAFDYLDALDVVGGYALEVYVVECLARHALAVDKE